MEATTLTAPLMGGSLQKEQIELEEESVRAGIRRYRKLKADAINRGEGDQLKPVQRLLVYWLDQVVEAVENERREIMQGESGPGRAQYAHLILRLDAETTACIALQVMLSTLMMKPTGEKLATVAYRIGQAFIAELAASDLKASDREMWKEVNALKGTPEYAKAREIALEMSFSALERRSQKVTPQRIAWWAGKHLDDDLPGRKARMALGAVLLHFLLYECRLPGESGGWVRGLEREVRTKGVRTIAYVKLTQASLDVIRDGDERRQLLRPRFLPMIMQPCAWNDQTHGGYVKLKPPLIIKQHPAQARAVRDANLSDLWPRLNALDATPFRISKRIFDVQKAIYDDGGGILGIPMKHDVPIPPKLEDGASEQAIKLNKADRAKAWETNKRVLPSLRQTFLLRMDVASMFKDRDAIYFPHRLDGRGRAYPHPQPLNHQGPDTCRAMLEFSHATPMNERGRHWLEIHTANCFGEDKMSLDDRQQWTRDHLPKIRRAARDPMADDWWHAADDPFQFLSACIAHVDEEHAAHLCAHIDGKCNGLQHYAAMGRDSEAARHVSLVDADRPSDVYVTVANKVEPIVRRDAAAGNIAANLVKDVISKPIVKRTVMTKVYGVTLYGAADHIADSLQEVGIERKNLAMCSKYLARVVLDAIGEVCGAADEIMDWLQKCAKVIVDQTDRAVAWTTPIGWPVVQPYFSMRKTSVRTIIQRIALRVPDEDCGVNKAKQVSGVAPNFVHSIDATHMLNIALRCRRESIAFAGVHDSFWSHLSHMDRLGRIAREEFVKLHQRPIIADLHAEWERKYDLELPEPPAMGEFDLESVLSATYAFA